MSWLGSLGAKRSKADSAPAPAWVCDSNGSEDASPMAAEDMAEGGGAPGDFTGGRGARMGGGGGGGGGTGDVAITAAEEEVRALRSALRRQEGENFLLHAQVKQLQQQAQETGREASVCFAQLGQALQLLESGLGLRAPMKPEVDRARAIVAGARRCLRRLSGPTPQTQASALAATADDGGQQLHRLSAPRGRARSPGDPGLVPPGTAPATATASSSGLGGSAVQAPQTPLAPAAGQDPRAATSLGASAAASAQSLAAVAAAPPTGTTCAPSGGAAPAASARRRSRGAPATQDDVKENAGGRGRGSAGGGDLGGSKFEQANLASPKRGGAGTNGLKHPTSTSADTEAAAAAREGFVKQRELLVGVLRRSAALEEQTVALKDDVTRRDVIIHNLRQEVQARQQEIQMQQAQFEQTQAQLQQQHQVQQLQQFQQLQDLQSLLQQHHIQLQLQPQPDGTGEVPNAELETSTHSEVAATEGR